MKEELGMNEMNMWSRNRRGCLYHGVKKKKKKIVRKYGTLFQDLSVKKFMSLTISVLSIIPKMRATLFLYLSLSKLSLIISIDTGFQQGYNIFF
jgi:hypothetical protein